MKIFQIIIYRIWMKVYLCKLCLLPQILIFITLNLAMLRWDKLMATIMISRSDQQSTIPAEVIITS